MALSTAPIRNRNGPLRCHSAVFTSRRVHSTVVIAVTGEIDAANAAQLSSYAADRLIAADQLVIDLTGLDFLAAQGISTLFTVQTYCAQRSIGWALVVGPAVGRTLRLVPTADLPVADSVPGAIGLARADRRHLPHCS